MHIITQEVFPLWVLNDKAHGGFNFQVGVVMVVGDAMLIVWQQTDIGLVILFAAPVQIVTQVVLCCTVAMSIVD